MSPGTGLQLVGAAFEFGGIVTVAWGIRHAGKKYNIPSIALRAWRWLVRIVAKVWPRKPRTVFAGQEVLLTVTPSLQARVIVGLGPWDDEELAERIERLRRAFENQEKALNELHGRLDSEENARREAYERLDYELRELRAEFSRELREADTGGLGLETIGVFFFAVGLVLGAWGNVLANR